MFNNIRIKLIVAFLAIVFIPLIGTGLYGNWITSRIISERAIESSRNDVRLHAEQAAGSLNHVRGDVLYISHLTSLEQLINARIGGDQQAVDYWLAQLAQDFLIFSAARPEYYQVRYITEDGQEEVRIESDGKLSHIIPNKDLQNKAHRYYFLESMQLPPDGIYVSPLDLNREQGMIEDPQTPVMRYAASVFDSNKQRRGIVIINVYAEHLFSTVRTGHTGLIIANQDGYFMVHPDEAKLWGGPNDMDTGQGIHQDYGENAVTILSGQEGKVADDSRIVVFTTLYPIASGREHFWVLMRDESASLLLQPVRTFRIAAVSILSFAAIIAFLMALFLAREFTAPILALRQGVEKFSRDELFYPVAVQTSDEIGQLTVAFNDMAGVIQQHLTQLSKLTVAGQRISSGLERKATLTAILEATKDLFAVEYCAISITDPSSRDGLPPIAIQIGNEQWSKKREFASVIRAGESALEQGQWQAVCLPDEESYFICAPLCLSPGKQGLIEVFGHDAGLLDTTCGSLLFTLAVESSIALENIELYESLDDHKHQLEKLVKQLIDAQEAERKFVAYDLHDGLVQYLVAARLQLSKIYNLFSDHHPDDQTIITLDEVMAHLTRAVQEGRRVIEGLRPTLLDNLGLTSALSELAREMGKTVDWSVKIDNQIGAIRLSPTVELTAFRIAQEALTNARKHAQASKVFVKLLLANDNLCLTIKDNGVGFDKSKMQLDRKCIGLASMRERTSLLGGFLSVKSRVNYGTIVSVKLPLKTKRENAN